MALTRRFQGDGAGTVLARPGTLRSAPYRGGESLLSSNVETAKSLLRDYVKCHYRIRRTRRTHGQVAEEPHAHTQCDRQSPRAQPV